jgi:hypothetical protein
MRKVAKNQLFSLMKPISYQLHQSFLSADSNISRAQVLEIIAASIGKNSWNDFIHSDGSLPNSEEIGRSNLRASLVKYLPGASPQDRKDLEVFITNLMIKFSYIDKPISVFSNNLAHLIHFHPDVRSMMSFYFSDSINMFNPQRDNEGKFSKSTVMIGKHRCNKLLSLDKHVTFLDLIVDTVDVLERYPELYFETDYQTRFTFQNLITENPSFNDDCDYVDVHLKVRIPLSNPLEMHIEEIEMNVAGKLTGLMVEEPKTYLWNTVKLDEQLASLITVFPKVTNFKTSVLDEYYLKSPLELFWPKECAA